MKDHRFKEYKLRKEMPGLGEGGILKEHIDPFTGRHLYHDEFNRIQLSKEIVEENWDWFEKVESK